MQDNDLNKDVEKMFDEVKTPGINSEKMIYESPDNGKTVYARRFGTRERILIKGGDNENE